MPDAVTENDLREAANSPASASVDGQSASAHPLSEIAKVVDRGTVSDALDGANSTGGGPVSGWSKLRMARARNCGAVQ